MIQATGLYKTYNLGKSNEFTALKNVNFSIQDGEFVAIIGKSGAGKSTLLHVLSGIDTFERGEVKIDSHSLGLLSDTELSRLRNKSIGIILQSYALLEEYSVYTNVVMPLYFSKLKRSVRLQNVLEALNKVGISNLSKKCVRELSGGQKQRVAIARALVNHPQYLFADEPTGSLDTKTSQEIMDLFHCLNKEGITILLITHNMELANSCNRILLIEDGRLAEDNAS